MHVCFIYVLTDLKCLNTEILSSGFVIAVQRSCTQNENVTALVEFCNSPPSQGIQPQSICK